MSSHQRPRADAATAQAGDRFTVQFTPAMQRRLRWLRTHHWPGSPSTDLADVAHWVLRISLAELEATDRQFKRRTRYATAEGFADVLALSDAELERRIRTN